MLRYLNSSINLLLPFKYIFQYKHVFTYTYKKLDDNYDLLNEEETFEDSVNIDFNTHINESDMTINETDIDKLSNESSDEFKTEIKFGSSDPLLAFFKHKEIPSYVTEQIYSDFLSKEIVQNETQIGILIEKCTNKTELINVLNTAIQHPLMLDAIHGHGVRVFLMQKVTNSCSKLYLSDVWIDTTRILRTMGFTLARNFIVQFLHNVKQWMTQTFALYGRDPILIEWTVEFINEIRLFMKNDRIPGDQVIYAKMINLLTSAISYFDRQHLYRVKWSNNDDAPRRDGIIVDWVSGNQRCLDFDYAVRLATPLVESLVKEIQHSYNNSIQYSIIIRLSEFYFQSDNVKLMISLLEYVRLNKIEIFEAPAAKLLQMCTAFNIKETPKIFIQWRIQSHISSFSSVDAFRMMMFYAKAGGGMPCPKCNEKYNHRNPSVEVWDSLSDKERYCALHIMSYQRKGELEDTPDIPQNKDYSNIAFSLLEISNEKNLFWSEQEWRAFLLCCINADKVKALKATKLVEDNLPFKKWDEFLKCTFIRVYRHHQPEHILELQHSWRKKSSGPLSPFVLHEFIMCAAKLKHHNERYTILLRLFEECNERKIYIFPYTRRYLFDNLDKYSSDMNLKSTQQRNVLDNEKTNLVNLIHKITTAIQ